VGRRCRSRRSTRLPGSCRGGRTVLAVRAVRTVAAGTTAGAVAAAATAAATGGAGTGRSLCLALGTGAGDLALVDPHLDADAAEGGAGLVEAVVDVGAQGV